jgi:penicillin-binding protein 2
MKTYPGSFYVFLSLLTILIGFNSFADPTPPTTAAKKAVAKKAQPQKATTATAKTATPAVRKKAPVRRSTAYARSTASAKPAVARASLVTPAVTTTSRVTVTRASRTTRTPVHRWVQTWDEPTFKDSTDGDAVDGEDLEVRKAAVEALGPYNGSIVVVDPSNGRILTMVNQRLALGGGFQPCSTIKVSVALAALHEGIIKQNLAARLTRGYHMDLTEAIAHSNNYYFATLGIKLGYDKVSEYAHQFGYGEKAGWNIDGEHPGYFPPKPPANGGMGMLTSFGEEISQTPLELAALMSAVENGGTLYWLQYPTSQEQIHGFTPQVKRKLDIQPLIEQIKPGLRGAVDFGTARRAKQDDMIMGKTGTCSQGKTHLGWFGSFNDSGPRKLVVVVLLTGGRPSIGPMAAGVAGDVYRRLAQDGYLGPNQKASFGPANLISTQICCGK